MWNNFHRHQPRQRRHLRTASMVASYCKRVTYMYLAPVHNDSNQHVFAHFALVRLHMASRVDEDMREDARATGVRLDEDGRERGDRW